MGILTRGFYKSPEERGDLIRVSGKPEWKVGSYVTHDWKAWLVVEIDQEQDMIQHTLARFDPLMMLHLADRIPKGTATITKDQGKYRVEFPQKGNVCWAPGEQNKSYDLFAVRHTLAQGFYTAPYND